jgi:filamentous hemagglutinin family protein
MNCFERQKAVSALGCLLFLLVSQPASVWGNPTGGAVVAGSATIGSAGSTLNITQSSTTAIINWQQFSIANGELTRFNVPTSSSATLNRVVGGNPSAIYGSLQSNGILYLVNPSGIVVGPSGRIDTAGFLASTLDVSNQQFLKGGDLNFAGASNASIDNEGTINASIGNVYLIASQVNNSGKLIAPQGNVGLAAGADVLFQQAGNEHLFVQATPAGTTRASGVTNTGTIRAAAAELKAAGGNAYALAINNTGSIAATGYKKVNGQVYLVADGGNISNSGKISAQTATGNGGTIVLNGSGSSAKGNTVLNSGTLDASATVAGGRRGHPQRQNPRAGRTGRSWWQCGNFRYHGRLHRHGRFDRARRHDRQPVARSLHAGGRQRRKRHGRLRPERQHLNDHRSHDGRGGARHRQSHAQSRQYDYRDQRHHLDQHFWQHHHSECAHFRCEWRPDHQYGGIDRPDHHRSVWVRQCLQLHSAKWELESGQRDAACLYRQP